MQDFFILQQFYNEITKTSSTNEKKKTLEKYKDNEFIKKILVATYHPFKQYYITSKNLKKKSKLKIDSYDNIFQMLDDLNERSISGNDAISAVNGFIEKFKPYEELIYQIIDRNLQTRATATIINDVIPNLIPTFSVQLCEVYEKVKAADDANRAKFLKGKKANWTPILDFENDSWFGSFKLDGYRCICIVDSNSDARFYSRAGNEFETLSKIKDEIKRLGFKDCVFDGEICINTLDGRDDFNAVQKEVNNKNHTIERPKLWIFDLLEKSVFDAEGGGETFTLRYKKLNELFEHVESNFLAILPQLPIKSDDDLIAIRDIAIEAGREGLIVKKDTPYQGKRTKDILKAKIFEDSEYTVIDVGFAKNRVIVNNVEVEEIMLAQVVIEHKGTRVGVGSGFSLEERRHFYKNPQEIIGTIITVKHQGESKDKNGNLSLRFPTLKALHGLERTM